MICQKRQNQYQFIYYTSNLRSQCNNNIFCKILIAYIKAADHKHGRYLLNWKRRFLERISDSS